MADELYAWSPIQNGDNLIKQGDKVTAGDVGGKDELEHLKEIGSVRAEKLPDMNADETPNEAKLRSIREQLEAMGSSPEDLAAAQVAADVPGPVEEVK